MTKNPSTATINLASANDCSAVKKWDETEREVFLDRCDFDIYLKKLNPSPLSWNDTPVYYSTDAGRGIVVNGCCVYGVFYGVHDDPLDINPHNKRILKDVVTCSQKNANPSAIILTSVTLPKRKKSINVLLLNGDEDAYPNAGDLVAELGDKHPTCSFACLNRFYSKPSEGIERLKSGKIKLLDFTGDKRIEAKSEEIEAFRTGVMTNLNPPGAGFSFLFYSNFFAIWHRSGTVLLHDVEKDWYILMGQDEDTYFGVQLPKTVKTVDQAYKLLIPDEVKGKSYSRQGEWFIINVPESDVPTLPDCCLYSRNGCASGDFSLPIETSDSNPHFLEADELRVSKNGMVYARNPRLVHDDHEDVSREGWCTFYKNTAIRSFSQEGVD